MFGFRTHRTSARSAIRFLPFLNRGRQRRLSRIRRGLTESAGSFLATADIAPRIDLLEDRTLLSVAYIGGVQKKIKNHENPHSCHICIFANKRRPCESCVMVPQWD